MTKQESFGRPGVLQADSNASDPVFSLGMLARCRESALGYMMAKALSRALVGPTRETLRSHSFCPFLNIFSPLTP